MRAEDNQGFEGCKGDILAADNIIYMLDKIAASGAPPPCPGSNPGSVPFKLCDLGQNPSLLLGSVPSI